jgi:hypothetical protein
MDHLLGLKHGGALTTVQLYKGTEVQLDRDQMEQVGIGRTICRSRFPYVYKYEAGPLC